MRYLFGWLTLKNLKIGQKLAVVGLPFLLLIGILSWIVVQRSAGDAGSAGRELEGVEQARPLRALLRDVIRHRALAARTLNGAGSARGDLEAAAAQADADAAAVDALQTKYGADLHTTEKWQAIRTRWAALKAGVLGMKPEASRDEHAALLADITALMSDVHASSGLVLDPEAGPHFLGAALLSSLPRAAAEADRLRAWRTRFRRRSGTASRRRSPTRWAAIWAGRSARPPPCRIDWPARTSNNGRPARRTPTSRWRTLSIPS